MRQRKEPFNYRRHVCLKAVPYLKSQAAVVTMLMLLSWQP